MPNHLYRINNKIISMDENQLLDYMNKLEERLRICNIKYLKPTIYKSQIEEIKSIWPTYLKDFLRTRAKELSGNQQVNSEHFRKSIIDSLLEVVVPKRCLSNNTRVSMESKMAISDFSLSMFLNTIPDVSDIVEPKKFKNDTISIKTPWGKMQDKLIVKCDEALSSSLYFLAFNNEFIKKSWIIGWAKNSDVVSAKRGNKITDPNNCPWNPMSYFLPLTSLRPMSDFLISSNIKEVQEGLVIEKIPDISELPILQTVNLGNFNEIGGDDFYSILGFDIGKNIEDGKHNDSEKEILDF